MSINVTHISKNFGNFTALDDVSLTVAKGRLTALLGPSGGGKSTLLRIIAGLEFPDSGSVEIEGRQATWLPPQKRSVGFVFQHYAAFKHLSVYRNVAFGLEIRRRPKAEIRARVNELLELVHLENFADRLPSQLSGGQRQRMALARALAVQPEVLLLDEPFGALDAMVRTELRAWLRRLHEEVNVTTIFVTHDQEEALEVADELVVINNGRIEQIGSPTDVYDHPANDFVMGFLGPVTHLDGRLVRPHDIQVLSHPGEDAIPATVTRLHRVGFEVRAELWTHANDGFVHGRATWVQLTRGEAERLGLRADGTVWLRSGRPPARLTAS
jgi:sulfate transport system ATP-binding protein